MAQDYSHDPIYRDCVTCGKKFSYNIHKIRRKFCSPSCIRYTGPIESLAATKGKGIWQTVSDKDRFTYIMERYEKLVIRSDGCWSWKNKLIANGYGTIQTGRNKMILAHRASWLIHNGEIPTGLLVLHKCDNPPCTNPDHLFLGTHKDNMQDCIRKGRRHARKGELHYRAKINMNIARQIKELIASGSSQSAIGRMFNISPSTVQNIADGKTWKDA